MKQFLYLLLVVSWLGAWQIQDSQAAFPDDFSDVTWLDPNISSWARTATITVEVSGSQILVNDTKRNVWPVRFHSTLGNSCCNRSLWIFIKYQGRWYASTFEYMRLGQIGKNLLAIEGGHIKRPPFLSGAFDWEPADGEVYGFMTSGMARFNLNNVNIQERSNVALYRWGEGPTDNINFDEVARNAQGKPIVAGGEDPTPPVEEEEECVEPPTPEPVINTHQFSGNASGTVVVTGNTNQTASLDLPVSISVSDDRSLTFTIDDESFTSQVNNDGSFSGKFTFDIGNLGVCIVDINVNGSINGTSASGTGSGSDACAGNTATLNATFSATSTTAPSYLDERGPIPTPRSVCDPTPNTSAIINLLLDEN